MGITHHVPGAGGLAAEQPNHEGVLGPEQDEIAVVEPVYFDASTAREIGAAAVSPSGFGVGTAESAPTAEPRKPRRWKLALVAGVTAVAAAAATIFGLSHSRKESPDDAARAAANPGPVATANAVPGGQGGGEQAAKGILVPSNQDYFPVGKNKNVNMMEIKDGERTATFTDTVDGKEYTTELPYLRDPDQYRDDPAAVANSVFAWYGYFLKVKDPAVAEKVLEGMLGPKADREANGNPKLWDHLMAMRDHTQKSSIPDYTLVSFFTETSQTPAAIFEPAGTDKYGGQQIKLQNPGSLLLQYGQAKQYEVLDWKHVNFMNPDLVTKFGFGMKNVDGKWILTDIADDYAKR